MEEAICEAEKTDLSQPMTVKSFENALRFEASPKGSTAEEY